MVLVIAEKTQYGSLLTFIKMFFLFQHFLKNQGFSNSLTDVY